MSSSGRSAVHPRVDAPPYAHHEPEVMPLHSFTTAARHPVAVVVRLLLWPTAILGLSDLASRGENDALAAGLTGFFVVAVLSFLLPLVDGLVLRTRPLLLVWSVTTVVVVGLMVAQPLSYAFVDGPEGTTWDYAVHAVLEDLPSSLAVFFGLVGVPVALGAVAGAALRRSVTPRGSQADRALSPDGPRAQG